MTFPLPSSPHWPPTRMMTMGLLGAGLGPPRLQVVEPRVVPAELELDHSGRAVAVLGHDHLGDAGALVGFVVLGPEKEHDEVRILLNGARFSQVAEDRSLVRTLLWCAAQLRDGEHRYSQLAGEALSALEIDDTSCTRLSSPRDRPCIS